jgi:hypothetical protein
MLEWPAAIAVFVLLIALLPRILRRTKTSLAKGGGAGLWVGIGLGFAAMFDPKIVQAMEIIEQEEEAVQEEESGDQP